MVFILDACSAINLLHIFKENNEILEDIFTTYEITFTLKVLEEIDKNIFVDKIFLEPNQRQNIRDIKNILFEENKNEEKKAQEYLIEITKYSKLNGEFFSSALALNLSRKKKDYIFFVTDDIPAKDEFQNFFKEYAIGDIISTSNFLYIFYQLHHESISIKESFFNLKREYLIEIKSFEENIIELLSHHKNTKELPFLNMLLSDLKNLDIERLQVMEVPNKLSLIIKEETKKIQEYMNQSFINKKILFDEIDSYIKLIQENKQYRL